MIEEEELSVTAGVRLHILFALIGVMLVPDTHCLGRDYCIP